MFSFSTRSKKCCICQNLEKSFLTCSRCVAVVCSSCLPSYLETGRSATPCPCCRLDTNIFLKPYQDIKKIYNINDKDLKIYNNININIIERKKFLKQIKKNKLKFNIKNFNKYVNIRNNRPQPTKKEKEEIFKKNVIKNKKKLLIDLIKLFNNKNEIKKQFIYINYMLFNIDLILKLDSNKYNYFNIIDKFIILIVKEDNLNLINLLWELDYLPSNCLNLYKRKINYKNFERNFNLNYSIIDILDLYLNLIIKEDIENEILIKDSIDLINEHIFNQEYIINYIKFNNNKNIYLLELFKIYDIIEYEKEFYIYYLDLDNEKLEDDIVDEYIEGSISYFNYEYIISESNENIFNHPYNILNVDENLILLNNYKDNENERLIYNMLDLDILKEYLKNNDSNIYNRYEDIFNDFRIFYNSVFIKI